MIRAAHAIYFTALGIWVGGLATLAFVAAPVAFKAVDRRTAGAVFGLSLRAFGFVEMACAALVVASSIFLWRSDPRSGRAEGVRLALVCVMLLLVFSYTLGVNPAVAAERERIADFHALVEGDPAKTRFDRLHRWSVRLVGANILTGFILMVLSAATIRSTR